MRKFFPCFVAMVLVLVTFSSSWSQCPEEPKDLGECDTLNVVCWDCEIDTSVPGPYFVRVLLLVTHDSNTFYWEGGSRWVQDSIAAFVTPLEWTRTNPSAYCSVSSYWNTSEFYGPQAERSIFRHVIDSETGDTLMVNRMMWMASQAAGWEWDSRIVQVDTDSSYFRMALVTTGQTDRRWWEGDRTLLATITLKVSDTMHVCIDSTFWAPNSKLTFTRYDSKVYFPRHNLPICFWFGPPRIEVTSPNGGENWCAGSTKNVTWGSENLAGNVKIDYSTNGGGSWNAITASTPNDGEYSWDIPPDVSASTTCRVKISDVDDDPSDMSDADFTISQKAVTVVSPNGGEALVVNEPHGITWVYSCLDYVSIEYSTNSGADWNTVVSSTPSDGFYTWQVPDTPSDSCRIRICDTTGTPCDTSDDDFSIGHRDFAMEAFPDTQFVYAGQDTNYNVVISPIYGFNSPCTLSVSNLPPGASGTFDPAIIVYPYTDTSVLTISTTDATPEGYYTITVTATETDKGISQLEHSTEVVLVVSAAHIGLTLPTGGEVWCAGKINEITWTSEGLAGSFIQIDYSTNAGTSWLLVEDSTENDGTYDWTPPEPPSDSCLVKVSDADGLPFDESDSLFAIFLAGDANADGMVNIADAMYIINYLFIAGPAPTHPEAGDVNVDGEINVADAVWIVNYLFIAGPAPEC